LGGNVKDEIVIDSEEKYFSSGGVNVPDEIDSAPDEIVIKKKRKCFVSETKVNVSDEIVIYKERKYFSSEGNVNVPDEIVIEKKRKCFFSETKVNVSDEIFCQQEENTIIKG